MILHEMPAEERPRERMLRCGSQALSNAELLAVLLRTGTIAENVVNLAGRVLASAGGLKQLVGMSVEQLMKIKGIGPAKALQLRAGIELGQRLSRLSPGEKAVIRAPSDAADLLMEELRYLATEHFVCLFLDTKNRVIAQETLSVGSLNASIVHPREVFRAAIVRSSASLICVHNHPSGDPAPSSEDVEITLRLVEAGRLLGISVLDHIIIGDRKYVSLKEQGLI
jgi:DNA repair protein RadC